MAMAERVYGRGDEGLGGARAEGLHGAGDEELYGARARASFERQQARRRREQFATEPQSELTPVFPQIAPSEEIQVGPGSEQSEEAPVLLESVQREEIPVAREAVQREETPVSPEAVQSEETPVAPEAVQSEETPLSRETEPSARPQPPEPQPNRFGLRLLAGSDDERGTLFELGEGETTIGRQAGSGVHLLDTSVSHAHAVITVSGDQVTISDTNSTNGTKVNDRYIEEPTELAVGDRLALGDAVLTLEALQHDE